MDVTFFFLCSSIASPLLNYFTVVSWLLMLCLFTYWVYTLGAALSSYARKCCRWSIVSDSNMNLRGGFGGTLHTTACSSRIESRIKRFSLARRLHSEELCI